MITLKIPDDWWSMGVNMYVAYPTNRYVTDQDDQIMYYLVDRVWCDVYDYGGRLGIREKKITTKLPNTGTELMFKTNELFLSFDNEEKAALFRLTYL